MKYLYLSKYTNPDGNEITYCGDNIKIRVKDKIVNNIFVFILSDLNIPHVFMIYKILTGHMPNDDAVRDLYAYEILTKLEACYPCVKDILRRDIYNPRICPSSIIVGCDKNGIRISVIYDKYDKRDIYNTAQAYSIGDKRIIDAVRKVYGYNWTKDLSKELSVVFNEKGDNNMKYPETAYISNDIEIHLNKRVINDITIYIPLYVKASDAVKIYDAIIGYGSLRPYEMLDELKKYYPYLKNIDRGEIDNDYIFTEDIGVFYEDTRIRITVEYNKYSKSVACHIDDKRVDLINILNLKKGSNMAKDRFYSWRDINVHVSDGVIDYMKLYIPSDLDQISIYDIYNIITGYIPSDELINEERSVFVDNKNAIKKMYFYGLLDELKKYYPSLKGIHRTEIYNTPIYPKDIDVCCKDKIIAITIKYGYTSSSFSIPNLSEIYSAIVSERYKLINHLYLITGEITFKFCNSDEKSLEEALNKLYGAPDKDVEKKVQTYCKNDIKVTKELKAEIKAAFGVPEFPEFDAITDELKDTYIKKNHDYGNSFDKSIDKFGLTAAVVRMNDKMERLSSLMNKDAKVDESIRDTVMDLANYCIMTAMYLDNKKEKK